MRILYVAHRHDYGRPELGLSFEHHAFYETLVGMGHLVDYFDLGAEIQSLGREAMNEKLVRHARASSPDLVFFFLFEEELEPAAVTSISDAGTPTFNWFADDHWRFESFTRRWAPAFTYVSTTATSALPKYAEIGCANVIKTQWAATGDGALPGVPLEHDVSFIGQVYGDRAEVIRRLRQADLAVHIRGTGWAVRPRHMLAARLPIARSFGGRVALRRAEASTRTDRAEMLRTFALSRVNLNLVAASQGSEAQIKARTFEVPACGGFLLDGRTADIERYYEPEKELVIYEDVDDLVEKAAWYLTHEDARRRIAAAGHARTLAEHTYPRRLAEIFAAMGLP